MISLHILLADYLYLLYLVAALSRAPTGSYYNHQSFLPNAELRFPALLQLNGVAAITTDMHHLDSDRVAKKLLTLGIYLSIRSA